LGENLAKAVISVLEEFGIEGKVSFYINVNHDSPRLIVAYPAIRS
jgi:hypothetical protein